MLEVGMDAPDFELKDHTGETHRLKDQRGSWVALYFYPKDDTPGCTTQACDFRDNMAQIAATGGKVFGLSADDEDSHRKFSDKHDLNFPLLVDPDKRVLEAYGAWGEKKNFGKTYMGVKRITYLIDPEGKIAKVWPNVKPEGHASDVRASIEELKSAA